MVFFVLNVENFNQLNHGWMIIKIEQVDDNLDSRSRYGKTYAMPTCGQGLVVSTYRNGLRKMDY